MPCATADLPYTPTLAVIRVCRYFTMFDSSCNYGHLRPPMELILALTCDAATLRPDGKLDISGVFNELGAPGFPAAQDRMTVVFIIEWAAGEEGTQPLRADLIDEKDELILTIQGETEVEARRSDQPPPQTRVVLPLEKVVFPHAGRYRFRVRAGRETRVASPLFVALRPELQDPADQDRV
jgi:hypothetical protein